MNEQDEDTINESYVERLMNEFQDNMKSGRWGDGLDYEFNKTLLNIRCNIDKKIEQNLSNESHEHIIHESSKGCREAVTNECHKMNFSKDITDDINNGEDELFCIEDGFNDDEGNSEQEQQQGR